MPATLPSHPAIVLPLKLWRPRWFDGVALVVGSAAPDLAYALDGTRLERVTAEWPATWEIAHSGPGVLLWSLPLTLLCGWLIRLAAPTIAAQLPGFFRDYALLRHSAPPWPITAVSAMIGAASHVLWDRLAVNPIADLAFSVIGAVVTVGIIVQIGRKSLLPQWHSDSPAPAPRSRRFWPIAAGVFLIGLIPIVALPGASLPHTTGSRLLILTALSLLLAAAGSRAISRRQAKGSPGKA